MKSAPWLEPPALGSDEVHIWWGRIDAEGGTEASGPGHAELVPALSWLSAHERARALGFRFERDRVSFIVRQSFLRSLLAGYTGADPSELVFAVGPHGKPRLASRAAYSLCFNLSHSQGWVLVGVARGRELGVDVEAHQLRTELGRIALQVLTERERVTLEGLDHDARLPAFFRGWTRKEAALKATGEGLAREPRTLEAGLAARGTGEVWNARDEPVLAGYTLADLAAPDGFGAAVCVEGDGWSPSIMAAWDRPVVLMACEASLGGRRPAHGSDER